MPIRIGNSLFSKVFKGNTEVTKVFLGTSEVYTTDLALYPFTTFTFTSAGAIGRFGPTLSTCVTDYTNRGATWASNTTYFNMNTQGIQEWTVPETGVYQIRAQGARGGTVSSTRFGGWGADMRGDFNLVKGEVLSILVGHPGTQTPLATGNKGGGGGSFVWKKDLGENGLLIAAGGGGGSQASANGVNASTTTSGTRKSDNTGSAGTNGNGTTNGAGWLTNGIRNTASGGDTISPVRPLAGGTGGTGYSTAHQGGFGGGGAGGGSPSTTQAGGGGGGYSGGAGLGTPAAVGGGGGGSFNIGTNPNNTISNITNGQITITRL
jgi:hypothetical protein